MELRVGDRRWDLARRALVVGVAGREGMAPLLAAGADLVQAEGVDGAWAAAELDASVLAVGAMCAEVEGAGQAAAALLAGATVLRTARPVPVRRAVDILAMLRAVHG